MFHWCTQFKLWWTVTNHLFVELNDIKTKMQREYIFRIFVWYKYMCTCIRCYVYVLDADRIWHRLLLQLYAFMHERQYEITDKSFSFCCLLWIYIANIFVAAVMFLRVRLRVYVPLLVVCVVHVCYSIGVRSTECKFQSFATSHDRFAARSFRFGSCSADIIFVRFRSHTKSHTISFTCPFRASIRVESNTSLGNEQELLHRCRFKVVLRKKFTESNQLMGNP